MEDNIRRTPRRRGRWGNIRENLSLALPVLGLFALPIRAVSTLAPTLYQAYESKSFGHRDLYLLWTDNNGLTETFNSLKPALEKSTILLPCNLSLDTLKNSTWNALVQTAKECRFLASPTGNVTFSSLKSNSFTVDVIKVTAEWAFNNVNRDIDRCLHSLNLRNWLLIGGGTAVALIAGSIALGYACWRRNANPVFHDPFGNYAPIELQQIVVDPDPNIIHPHIPPDTDHKKRLADIDLDPDVLDNEDKFPSNFLCPIARAFMTNPVVLDTGHTIDYSSLRRMEEPKRLPYNQEELIKSYAPNFALRETMEAFVVQKEAEFRERQETEASYRLHHFSLS